MRTQNHSVPIQSAVDPIKTVGMDDLRTAFDESVRASGSRYYRSSLNALPINPTNLHSVADYLLTRPQVPHLHRVAADLRHSANQLGHLTHLVSHGQDARALIAKLRAHGQRLERVANVKQATHIRHLTRFGEAGFAPRLAVLARSPSDPWHLLKSILTTREQIRIERKFGLIAGVWLGSTLSALSIKSIADLEPIENAAAIWPPDPALLKEVSAQLTADAARVRLRNENIKICIKEIEDMVMAKLAPEHQGEPARLAWAHLTDLMGGSGLWMHKAIRYLGNRSVGAEDGDWQAALLAMRNTLPTTLSSDLLCLLGVQRVLQRLDGTLTNTAKRLDPSGTPAPTSSALIPPKVAEAQRGEIGLVPLSITDGEHVYQPYWINQRLDRPEAFIDHATTHMRASLAAAESISAKVQDLAEESLPRLRFVNRAALEQTNNRMRRYQTSMEHLVCWMQAAENNLALLQWDLGVRHGEQATTAAHGSGAITQLKSPLPPGINDLKHWLDNRALATREKFRSADRALQAMAPGMARLQELNFGIIRIISTHTRALNEAD